MNLIAKTASPGPGVSVLSLEPWKTLKGPKKENRKSDLKILISKFWPLGEGFPYF